MRAALAHTRDPSLHGTSRTSSPTGKPYLINPKDCMESVRRTVWNPPQVVWNPPKAAWNLGSAVHGIRSQNGMETWMGKKASHRIYGRGNPSPTGLFIIHYSSFIIHHSISSPPTRYTFFDALGDGEANLIVKNTNFPNMNSAQ